MADTAKPKTMKFVARCGGKKIIEPKSKKVKENVKTDKA